MPQRHTSNKYCCSCGYLSAGRVNEIEKNLEFEALIELVVQCIIKFCLVMMRGLHTQFMC